MVYTPNPDCKYPYALMNPFSLISVPSRIPLHPGDHPKDAAVKLTPHFICVQMLGYWGGKLQRSDSTENLGVYNNYCDQHYCFDGYPNLVANRTGQSCITWHYMDDIISTAMDVSLGHKLIWYANTIRSIIQSVVPFISAEIANNWWT